MNDETDEKQKAEHQGFSVAWHRMMEIKAQGLKGNEAAVNRLHIEISQLSRVTHLDFSGYGLEVLPEDIGTLMQLEELDLQDNPLCRLPDCIEKMLTFTKDHPDLLAKAQHGFVKNLGAA